MLIICLLLFLMLYDEVKQGVVPGVLAGGDALSCLHTLVGLPSVVLPQRQ